MVARSRLKSMRAAGAIRLTFNPIAVQKRLAFPRTQTARRKAVRDAPHALATSGTNRLLGVASSCNRLNSRSCPIN